MTSHKVFIVTDDDDDDDDNNITIINIICVLISSHLSIIL